MLMEIKLLNVNKHNKRGQTDRIPRCSFVPNGTSLAQLHPAAYRQRYIQLEKK